MEKDMEKTSDTVTTSWVPGAVWTLFAAGALFIWIPVASFACIALGLLGTYIGVPKSHTRRRAMLIVGWALLAALAVVIVIGAILWSSF